MRLRTIWVCVSILIGVVFLPASVLGAAQDKTSDDGRSEVLEKLDIPSAPVLSPEASLKRMKVAPGFRVELVAAEPLIHDPVAMAFDAEGRLWVVEMRSYMPNPDGEGEDKPTSRVVVLEDEDGDGRMDGSTIFMDGLVLPRAIAMVEGGVLIAEPPRLWFCRDTDGDLKAEEKRAVYDSYAEHGHTSRSENGLLRALDNWRYNAASATRMRFEDGGLIAEPTARRGDWGIAQDSYGRLYTCTNSSWLHADYLPAEYLLRNPDFPTTVGLYERVVNDQAVWPVRINPGVNRGYREGALREDGRLAHTTSACGPTIYRGNRYPAGYRGNAFVAEPAGNCVARFALEESGLELAAEHETYDDPKWGRREFLASTDERFRPVNTYTGPDGCLYVVDFYRGVIEYKRFVTPYLRGQIERRGLAKPLGLGRIYRIVPTEDGAEASEARNEQPRLAEASGRALVNRLSHPNGWWRDTAQRLLVQRRDAEAMEPLRSLAVNGSSHLGRLHALWTLHGMDALDGATVLAGMSDPRPKVRAAAVRTGQTLLGTAAESAYVSQLIEMVEERSAHVRVQAMLTLGELDESAKAEAAMARLLARHAGNRYMRHAALSGLSGREPHFTRTLLREADWAEPNSGRRAVLENLGAAVFRGRDAKELTAFLKMIAERPGESRWQQAALLAGLVNAEKKPKPVEMDETPEAFDKLAEIEDEAIRRHLKRLRSLLKTPNGDDDPEMDKDSEPAPLTEGQKKQYATGEALYKAVCMACHQADGKGQPGVAPSLIGTPWVVGSEERLTRIVLDGLQGPITVGDERWNLVMPGHRQNPILSDERIAAILTYIRRTWGNEASPVATETVERIRKATEDREKPWTVKGLKRVGSDDAAGEKAE